MFYMYYVEIHHSWCLLGIGVKPVKFGM